MALYVSLMSWKSDFVVRCVTSTAMEFLSILILSGIFLYLWDWYSKKRLYDCSKIIPGPKLKPFVGNSLEFAGLQTEDFFQKLIDLANQNERFFRLWATGKFCVFLHDPKDIEVLLVDNANLKKSDLYRFLVPWIGDGLLTTTGQKWKRQRKTITPAFHFTSLDAFFQVFNKNGQIIIECLETEVGKGPFNIFNYVNRAALDNICETAMGVEYNIQRTLDSAYLKAVKTICRTATHRIFEMWLWPEFIFSKTKFGKEQETAIKFIDNSTSALIQKRRKELAATENILTDNLGKPKATFLDMLLLSSDSRLNDEEIRDEINTFMFEGHDTVSSGTSFTLFSLANHQDIQEKVYQELITVLGDNDEPITMAKSSELPYMQKVIKEAMRMYPPSGMIGRELESDLTLKDGIVLPRGTNVLVNIFGTHRNPKLWPNPGHFNPENFANETQPFTFIPFSAGARNCIGQKFAILEMKTIISYVLRKYRVLPSPDPKHKLLLTSELVIISKTGQHICIEKRKQ